MMNTNSVAKNYCKLSAEERFRLIFAAGSRGDTIEQGRLARAGRRLTLSVEDHAPFAHAHAELSMLAFVELLDGAADYLEALLRANDARMPAGDESEGSAGDDGAEDTHAKPGAEGREAERWLDVALALGYSLKAKADGWKLFCERKSLPPFAAWAFLPGFDRLQRALKLAERVAFVPAGFARWLSEVRPTGETEVTSAPITTEQIATGLDRLFREMVEWWGGPPAAKAGEGARC
jgi:hypothetical protein